MHDAFDTVSALKALGAAFAGRALLLLDVRRDIPITLRRVLTVILWEIPLIAAFALIGWHVAALIGFDSESGRIVVTALLSNLGARGMDRLVSRVLPPPGGPGNGPPT
jgi:hypothetical protein